MVFSFLHLNNTIFLVVLSALIAVVVIAYFLFRYFEERNNNDNTENFRRRNSLSVEEENDTVPSRATTPTEGLRRRLRRNPFKAIYSNISTSHLPHILQRRHSTVFPLQVAKAAKDFIRGRGAYKSKCRKLTEEILSNNPRSNSLNHLRYLKFLTISDLSSSNWILNREDIDVVEYDADEYIVRPGDEDDSMYVVLEGSLSVYISLPEGKECMVKRIDQGNSFFSLLSLIDILMRMPSRLKQFCFRKFQEAYEANPEVWVRPIQIIVTRLLHVTMTTLHEHLGLGEELLKSRLDEKSFDDRHRNISGHSMKLIGNSAAGRGD
uniref:Cyclic nucleotide-binding domain-containing protein n=1 Tax=Ditylenchus dipsaci TaxID=166011 RepID=A0A915CP12_9BILA